MKGIQKQRWCIVRDSIIGWTVAFVVLSIVRGVGTVETSEFQMDFRPSLVFALVLGIFFGAISGGLQILTEERIYRRTSIQHFVLLRLCFSLSAIAALVGFTYFLFTTIFDKRMDFTAFAIGSASSFAFYFYILTVDILMAALRLANLLLGERNLGRMLRGRFYTPHEEERIFMFLDLQSSTQLAERIGHIQYSRLIQDCFDDLGVVIEAEAEIYQYVGDEVILTWKLKDGLRNQNCLRAFYLFKQELYKNRSHYYSRYGCLPGFKAGMNGGMVTTTEVGKYKREIAYHGDTINTAARIREKCNEFGEELLISSSLVDQLNTAEFDSEELGYISLKGKQETVRIFAVRESHDHTHQPRASMEVG